VLHSLLVYCIDPGYTNLSRIEVGWRNSLTPIPASASIPIPLLARNLCLRSPQTFRFLVPLLHLASRSPIGSITCCKQVLVLGVASDLETFVKVIYRTRVQVYLLPAPKPPSS
jgi:hypothetical protein